MEPKKNLEEVIEEYKTNPKMTEREKAFLEAAAWSLRGPDVKLDRREWVAMTLGIGTGEVEKRARINSVGEAADALWEAIEIDLSYNAATELLVTARQLAHRNRLPMKEAIQTALAQYQDQPITKYLANNKVVRGKGASSSRKVVVDFSERPTPPIDVKAVVEEKNFWGSIRKQFAAYAEKRLVGFEGIEKADIKRNFENELRTVIESLRVKIHLRTSRRKTRISWSEMVSACVTLAMDPPEKRGELPDLQQAKSRKRALGKEYHPDLSGTHATAGSMNEVLEAYETIESYCSQMKQSEAQGMRREGNNYNGGNDE